MAWWIFLGRVTSPIDYGISAFIDERGPKPVVVKRKTSGPTVLTPRLKFEAPMSAVAHLRRLKHVAPLKPHQIPKQEKIEVKVEKKETPVAPVAPKEVPKSEEKPKDKSSDEQEPVVASSMLSEEAVIQDAVETGEEKEKSELEEQKEKGGRKKSRKRRG